MLPAGALQHLINLYIQDKKKRKEDMIGDRDVHSVGRYYPSEEELRARRTSDGSTASYYELPEGANELQHLISHKDMNAQMGEIFRATYRYGECSHSDKLRDIKKITFYAKAELERLTSIKTKVNICNNQ